MPARAVVLVPPSEGKAEGGDGPPWSAGTLVFPELDRYRLQVLRALGRRHPARTSPTAPAIARYTGVLYGELAAASLAAPARRRLDRNLLVVSGLWGVVGPTDPIPHYRLKMSANVAPLGKLSTWWRPKLTAAVAERIDGAVVWDLLPNEHVAALDWNGLRPRTRITATFLDPNGRTVSHWNKLLKGSIVRWLAQTGETDPRALAGFDHPQGYRLDEASSTFEPERVALVLRQD